MKRYGVKQVCALVLAALCGGALADGTVYVDCNLSDYTGHDGSSWEKALKTIQEGVDKAAADDTVLVQPGRYEEGGKALSGDSYLTNRVYISKRITVKSRYGRDSRDTTFIVGRHATVSDDPGGMGMGLDAVRCVRFEFNKSTHGAVLEGFTLVNGGTHYNQGKYAGCSIGGGAYFGARTENDADASYLVDCVISNCVATRGAAMYFGNAVRCRMTRNYAPENSAGARDANLYWSLVDNNFGSGGAAYLGKTRCVNCTIVNNPNGDAFRGNSTDGTYATALNSVILHNLADTFSPCTALTNCVTDAACTYYWGDKVASGCATDDCVSVANTSFQFVSTATGDYRPLAAGALPGVADAKHLLRIPEPYRYTDLFGRTVTNAGAIVAGAIQETVTPRGGVIQYASFAFRAAGTPGVKINGNELSVDKSYDHALTYPRVHRLEFLPATSASTEFFGFQCNLDSTNSVYAFPNRVTADIAIMAPPPDTVLTVTPQMTANVLWTDPSVADGTEMDGTAAKPFNTLQAAVDKAAETKGFCIVRAKKGRYNRGGMFHYGHNNRVALTVSGLYMRFIAVDGPDETFIEGAADPASAHVLGYGDDACRCFASITSCAQLSGFTLTGGRVRLNGSGSEDPGTAGLYGGAIYGSEGLQVEDCVITNCAASRGAVAWCATLKRCRITDCISSRLGVIRGTTHASACVFERVRSVSNQGDHIIGQDEKTYNCTFVSTPEERIRVICNNANASLFNGIAYAFADLKDYSASRYGGSYYDAIAQVDAAVAGYEGLRETAIGFVGAAEGDYAPYSASKVVAGASAPPENTDFWRFGAVDDIEGKSFGYETGGPVNAGAYSRTGASMAVEAGAGETAGVSPEGVTFLTPGQSVTLTATKAETRNYQGFYSGETCLTAEATLTVSYDAAMDGVSRTIEARYVPYWYVDPAGSDLNGGRSWTDAKKTLAEVMKLALSGDTVYAAPGVYEEGSAHQDIVAYKAPSNLFARVVVPEGVALVSRDGAASTTIKGAAATVYANDYGCGSNALRCVYLYPKSRLVGFTVSGGRGSRDADLCDDGRGAGVHGSGDYSQGYWTEIMPVVKDCIITNCISVRGAGATFVKAVNCRFVDNRATGLCAATQHCQLHNCYVNGNHGDYAVGYSTGMYNCTFGAKHDGGSAVVGPSAFSGYNQRPYVYNSLFLCSLVNTGDKGGAFTNCVFNAAVLKNWPANNPTNACLFVPAEQLTVDEEGVPVIGANVAVDYGVTNYLDLALCGDADCAGRARRVNGERLDVGAYEADWKARYAADLGSARLVKVAAASNAVLESAAGTVTLTDGTALDLEMYNPNRHSAKQVIRLRVTGAGTLSMTRGGTPERTFTDAGGESEYVFTSTDTTQTFGFSFAGEGVAELIACSLNVGSAIFLR